MLEILFTCFSYFIYNQLFISANKIVKIYECKIRLLSFIHAIFSSVISFLFLYSFLNVSNYYYLSILTSTGYFFIDLQYILSLNTNWKLNASYLFHHLLGLYGIYQIPYYPKLIAGCFFTEISTPFINISWFLHKIKYKKNWLYFINAGWILYCFIIFRIKFYYESLSNSYNASKVYLAIYLMLFLNLMWTSSLIILFVKDLIKFLI